MSDSDIENDLPATTSPHALARARTRIVWGGASFEAEAQITPTGLLAVGAMVGVILLAVAPIVRAAGRARARR
jgi:hypothetical protein